MIDIVTEAIILKKEFIGDFDATYTFFTKDHGKLKARATSVRKITSRLAAHLEPGLLSKIRLVARNGILGSRHNFQIADALLTRRLFSDFSFLDLISGMSISSHADQVLWNFLIDGNSDRKKLLMLCGFGENQACISCGEPAATLYHPEQEFMCASCSSRIPKELVTYI